MSGIRNIIFDFDGTLVDTAPLIIATMQATIARLQLPPKSDSQCRATIGLRLEAVAGALWPQISDISQKYADTYRRIFETLRPTFSITCFPGVIDTLRLLHDRGCRLAIASSRSHRSLDEYVDSFDIRHLFDSLIGGDDVSEAKPAPEPVLKICRTLRWDVAETLVVGDTIFDIGMGRNAGSSTCAVTYGNQSRDELLTADPDAVIDSFDELPDLLTF